MLNAIACVDTEGNIGYKNKLLIRIPKDLKRFKDLTTKSTVIIGYNTYMSLPNRPLPNRHNIVITSKDIEIPGCEVVHSIQDIIDRYAYSDEEAWVIGGASVYEQLLPYCVGMYLTVVKTVFKDADKKISMESINKIFTRLKHIKVHEHIISEDLRLKVYFYTLRNKKMVKENDNE